MYKTIFIISILLTAKSISTLADENWKLEKNKDNIKIWTRKPENSNLKEFKGVTVVNAPIEKVESYFRNYSNFDSWMYKVEKGSVKELKKINENEFYILTIMNPPLIKNRDIITKYTFNSANEKGVIIINVDNASNFIPENNKYVRIKRITALWKLTPMPNNQTEIYHQAITDPGGSVPIAFVNMAIADAPFSMLTKLKEQLNP